MIRQLMCGLLLATLPMGHSQSSTDQAQAKDPLTIYKDLSARFKKLISPPPVGQSMQDKVVVDALFALHNDAESLHKQMEAAMGTVPMLKDGKLSLEYEEELTLDYATSIISAATLAIRAAAFSDDTELFTNLVVTATMSFKKVDDALSKLGSNPR